MRLSYTTTTPGDHELACRKLEALAEGLVRAAEVEIAADPEAFPCCIRCGKFVQRNAPLTDAERGALRSVLAKHDEDDRPWVSGTNWVRSPQAMTRHGGGTPLELAVYAAAQKRQHDGDADARVVIECVGTDGRAARGAYRPLVLLGNGTLHDPIAECVKVQKRNGCGCAGHDDSHLDEEPEEGTA